MLINVERLKKNIYELAKFSDEGKGIKRLSFTKTYKKGINFVRELMEDAGLTTKVDSVGNLIGRIEGKDKDEPAIIIGSHIDTVPHGGMFDGTVGVLGGIEVIKTLKENRYYNNYPLELISFIDEEGTAPALIGGTFGSRAMMGLIDVDTDLRENLKKVDLLENDVNSAYRDPHTIKNYLELHIEQGRILYDEKIPIGIVTGIVGIWRYVATVRGTSNHAGTTPMYARDDALLKSLPLIKGVNDIAKELDKTLVGTVGKINVKPGAANVIPGEVEVTIELRELEVEIINEAIARIKDIINKIGDIALKQIEAKHPSLMDKNVQLQIERACQSKSIKYKYMPSGAGHDAREMAKKVPSGLIFVPSREGKSHVPEELTELNDIREGVDVLLESIKLLDME
ncbi:MAG: Zn-dependent hydrolase [Desulfobacteraceae bacterium]|nr:MAG: Zn-dependent hydrolase [Desulfobacteraceae bacterium]